MYDIVKDIWRNPGPTYSLMPLWHWNALPEREELVRQMDDFHRKGIDGFVIRPEFSAEEAYWEEDYPALLRFVCEEAKKRFMLVMLSAGEAATALCRRLTEEDRRYGQRVLYCQPAEEPVKEGDEICYRLWLTLEEGKLARAGIGPADGDDCYHFILGYAQPGEGLDLLNEGVTRCFLADTVEKHLEGVKEYLGSTVIGYYAEGDMLEYSRGPEGGILWSYATMEYFFEEGGEVGQIASLFFETKNKKDKREAEYVYQKALLRNRREAFWSPLAETCRQKNIALTGYPQKDGDADTVGLFHVPGHKISTVHKGEELTDKESYRGKLAADCARHRGGSRSAVTCFGDHNEALTLGQMMHTYHFLLSRGCSMLIPDGFYYAPALAGEGKDLGPARGWWPEFRKIAGYLKRLSWLGGVGDDHPAAAVLCAGEQLPVLPVRRVYELGFTFHYLTIEDLMERAQIRDGKIAIDRYLFDTVLIDGRLRLNAEIVKKLGYFVTAGGKMYRGSAFGEFMRKNGKKGWHFDGETGGALRVIQYTKSGCPLFLLVNDGETVIRGKLITELSCRAENFDPISGTTSSMTAEMTDGGFAYSVTLAPGALQVIGMDPDALPLLGQEEKRTLSELVALGEGRMDFTYKAAEGRGAKVSFVSVDGVAELFVNGQAAGKLFVPPYELDVTKYLQEGENTLAVQVKGDQAEEKGAFSGCTLRITDEG